MESVTCDHAVVAEGIYLEGLSVDHARQVTWYSDVIAGGVHGVRRDGTPVATFDPGRMWTGGVLMNADGAVLSSGQGGIRWNHLETGRSGWLLTEIEGAPVNGINEMVPDGQGGIFFGTNDIERVIAAGQPRPTAIYRLTARREVIRLAEGMSFTNGLMFDAGRRRFYANDTFGKSYAWDVRDDLTLANKTVLLDRNDGDGMALQADGTIWLTGVYSPGIIRRLSPDGRELEPFRTPPGTTTQIRFGGADMRDVWITLVPADAGQALKDGKPLTDKSQLCRGRSDWAGMDFGTAGFVLD